MVRDREVSVVDIWPCRAGEAAAGACAKASRSRRTAVDCLRAELKRAFYHVRRPDAEVSDEGLLPFYTVSLRSHPLSIFRAQQ
jgi:hypothetical protein